MLIRCQVVYIFRRESGKKCVPLTLRTGPGVYNSRCISASCIGCVTGPESWACIHPGSARGVRLACCDWLTVPWRYARVQGYRISTVADSSGYITGLLGVFFPRAVCVFESRWRADASGDRVRESASSEARGRRCRGDCFNIGGNISYVLYSIFNRIRLM